MSSGEGKKLSLGVANLKPPSVDFEKIKIQHAKSRKQFLIMEPFSAFISVFCGRLPDHFASLVHAEHSTKETNSHENVNLLVASILTLIYAYISDNFLGLKKVTIVTGLLASIPVLICVIAGASQFYPVAHSLHSVLLSSLFNSYFLSLSFRVMWRILAVEQAQLPNDRDIVRTYIALLECMRLIGTVAVRVSVAYVIKYSLVVAIICLLLHAAMIAIIFIFKRLHSEPFEFNVINRYLWQTYKFFKDKIQLKNLLAPSGNMQRDTAGRPSIQLSFKTKVIIGLMCLMLFSFPFFIVHDIVYETVMQYQTPGLTKHEVIFTYMDPQAFCSCLMIIIILVMEYIILPMIKACRISITYFYLITMAYIFVTMNIVFCSLLEHKVQGNMETRPIYTSGQLRIYNLKEETVNVSSAWFPEREIKSWESLSILGIRIDEEKEKDSTNLTVGFENHTVFIEKGESRSCLISPEGFTMLNFTDPIAKGPPHASDNSMARVYIVTPATSESVEEMVIWVYDPDSSSVELKFPQQDNTAIFNVFSGNYSLAFRRGPDEQHIQLEKRLIIENGAVYLVVLMKSQRKGSIYGTYMHSFNVLLPKKVSFTSVYTEIFILSLEEVLINVYLFTFIYVEAPPKIRTCFLSLIFVSSHYCFGYRCFYSSDKRLTDMNLLTLSFVAMIALFFYSYVVVKYKGDETTRYVFQRKKLYY